MFPFLVLAKATKIYLLSIINATCLTKLIIEYKIEVMSKGKKVVLYLGLVAVIVFAVIAVLFFAQKKDEDLKITLFYPIDGKTQSITLPANSSLEGVEPNEYDGYEFVGWFFDNNLTMPASEKTSFSSSLTLVAGYKKIIYKLPNINITENAKFVKIISQNNAKLTKNELKTLIGNHTTYIDASECNFETDTLETGVFQNSEVTNLSLFKNITSIESGALSNCYNLKNLTLPEGLVRIGSSAFIGCKALENISLPSTLETLNENVFAMTNIKKLSLGKNVKELCAMSFANSKIEKIDIDSENPNFKVEGGAIYNQDKTHLVCVLDRNSKEILVNSEVRYIDDYAFFGSKVKSVSIGENIESIGKGSFKNCTNLQKITINNAKSYIIGESAFENCTNLSEIDMGTGLKEIKEKAFCGVSKIEEFIFHSSTALGVSNLERIEDGAFKNCTGLKRITLPDSVVFLGSEAFYNCINLSGVTLSIRIDSIKERTFCGDYNLESVTSASNIASVEDFAFSGCKKLSTIDCLYLSDTLGTGAFKNCASLSRATFDRVESIKRDTFFGCENLTETSFAMAKDIESGAFEGCKSLTRFMLSNVITSIDDSAFDNSGLEMLDMEEENNSFYCDRETGVLYNAQKNAIICYPISKKAPKFTIQEQILKIQSSSFFKNPYLEEIEVEHGNTAFSSEGGVLYNSDFSTLIMYPKNNGKTVVSVDRRVSKIGKYAFANNKAISLLTIPNTVTEIESGALFNMQSLVSLNLPFVGESLSENRFIGYIFGASDFSENGEYLPKSLVSVNVTDDTCVAKSSFYGASSLTYVSFNKQVEVINEYAFCNAMNLRTLVFEGVVTEICDYSLYNLNSLSSIKMGFTEDLVVGASSIGGDMATNVVVSIHNSNQLVSKNDRRKLEDKFTSTNPELVKVYKWDWKYLD